MLRIQKILNAHSLFSISVYLLSTPSVTIFQEGADQRRKIKIDSNLREIVEKGEQEVKDNEILFCPARFTFQN